MAQDRQLRRQLSLGGIAAILFTKGTDLLSTVYGLALVEGVTERNPVANAVLTHAGLAGLALSAVIGTLVVILVVEWGVDVIDRLAADERLVVALYLASYGPLVVLYTAATINNVSLILTVGQ